MRRKRKPTDCATQITDLPKQIFHSVLLKLSTKRIFVCKFVCKTWRDLISDPEFANSHFAQAEPFPLVWPLDKRRMSLSRTLYMAEPEDSSEFDLKHCACAYKRPCDRSHVHMSLTKYKIPLRNAEEVIRNQGNAHLVPLDEKDGTKKKGIRLKKCHKCNTVNSCNGLLCLAEPTCNDPAVVCNPITGEFINLPVGSKHDEKYAVIGGFGFSAKTNEYKVIRTFIELGDYPRRVAEVHTLGTGSWKSVGSAPYYSSLKLTSVVDGAVYWLNQWRRQFSIDCFDLDSEQFQSVPRPPLGLEVKSRDMSIGVLGGCLCVFHADGSQIHVWEMNDSGVEKAWSKKITIVGPRWTVYGSYIPMKYSKDGGLLMFHSPSRSLVYHHPENDSSFIYLKFHGFKSDCQAVRHVPSFVSLKDILVGKDVQVLNIHSRCAGLKLVGEMKPLILEEQNCRF